jgi:hypothetical protein
VLLVDDAGIRRRLDTLSEALKETLKLLIESSRLEAQGWSAVHKMAEAQKKSNHQIGDILIDFNRRITALERAAKKKPRKSARHKSVKRKRRT